MKVIDDLSVRELRRLLHYDRLTGLFRWRVSRGGTKGKGSIAGCTNHLGYIHITINGRNYRAHRLAWLYVYEFWPSDQLDHINRITDDNRIENLREVTNRENNTNRSPQSNNSSGVTGVYWNKRVEKWQAQIGVNGELIYLGLFTRLSDAKEAKYQANIKYGFAPFHGYDPEIAEMLSLPSDYE